MKTPAQINKKRLNLRLKRRAKNLLERAASLEGKTVSKFVLHSALKQAKKTIYEHESLALNAENSKALLML